MPLSIFKNVGPLLTMVALAEFWCAIALSQPVPPMTPSGMNTQIDPTSTASPGQVQYDITGGTRAGTNLFHSFGTFNVPTGAVANFLNDTGLTTTNILSRVTGGQPSTILGTIQTSGFGQANLFLMNPAGIVLGPSASLNVGGSVAFTTADYLRLADNGRFHALPDMATDALLSTAPVAAYGFLGAHPESITVRGSQLTVQERQGLSLVGGTITIDAGKLTTDGARSGPLRPEVNHINLAGVASPGEVLVGTLDYAANVAGQSLGALGTVHISDTSVLDASGAGGGTVHIRGGRFVIENSRISANVTGSGPITNGTESVASGIDIGVNQDAVIRNNAVLETNILGTATPSVTYSGVRLQAGRIEIAGSGFPPSFTGIRSNVGTDVQGHAQGGKSGNIVLEADSILINGMGALETIVHGAPAQPDASPSISPTSTAGGITVTADRDIELNGSMIRSYITSHAGTSGDITLTSNHGNIVATGDLVSFTSFNVFFAQSLQSPGTVGTVRLTAPDGDIRLGGTLMTLTLQPVPDGLPVREAGSGQVFFNARNMELRDNSWVQMDNFSTLPAGSFHISLTGNLTVTNAQILTTARGSAQAADLNVRARDVVIQDNALLSTETMSRGDGGRLNLIVDNLQVLDGGQLRSGSTIPPPPQFPGAPLLPIPSGAGQDITVQGQTGPANSVRIDGQRSGIFSSAEGTGPAGNAFVSAHTVTLQNEGTIAASTKGPASSATGGSIIVNATNEVTLSTRASITAGSVVDPKTPNSGSADAGNIFINAGQQLELLDQSSIATTTQSSKANGGNIDIQAIDRVRLVNSEISTSVKGAEGSGGNIFIDPNVVILQGSEVTAKAVGGAGGNITFVTPLFLADSVSVVSASSERGPSGTVTIQSPTSNLSGAVGQLVSKTSPPQMLLQNRCVALGSPAQSTFILAGRDALPSDPGGWLTSPVAIEHWMGEETEHASSLMVQRREPNNMPTLAAQSNETNVLSLRRLTPPGFSVRTFAVANTGCPS